jgi:hypothetical protein
LRHGDLSPLLAWHALVAQIGILHAPLVGIGASGCRGAVAAFIGVARSGLSSIQMHSPSWHRARRQR